MKISLSFISTPDVTETNLTLEVFVVNISMIMSHVLVLFASFSFRTEQ